MDRVFTWNAIHEIWSRNRLKNKNKTTHSLRLFALINFIEAKTKTINVELTFEWIVVVNRETKCTIWVDRRFSQNWVKQQPQLQMEMFLGKTVSLSLSLAHSLSVCLFKWIARARWKHTISHRCVSASLLCVLNTYRYEKSTAAVSKRCLLLFLSVFFFI